MLLKPPFLRPKSKRLLKRNAVTVCIAALCNNGTVLIGASDRMMTGEDMIEYEPNQTKLFVLTKSLVVMFAGSTSLQIDILQRVQQDVEARVAASPDDWWSVRDVAFLYNKYYNEEKSRRAESSLLAPLGLNNRSFLKSSLTMSPSVVKQLTEEIVNFEMPETETIFAGVDQTGAHIYVATGPNISCHDLAGFAAIGGGSWHANSQFMFGAHSRFSAGPESLFLTYYAKKRAQIAPGVGEKTDMWTMGPSLGSLNIFPQDVIEDIEAIYLEYQANAKEKVKESEVKMNDYVAKLAAGPQLPQAQVSSPALLASSGEAPVGKGEEKGNSI